METSNVSQVLIKIAQRTQPKKMAAFMRQFVDYVILSLPPATPNMSHLDNVRDVKRHNISSACVYICIHVGGEVAE